MQGAVLTMLMALITLMAHGNIKYIKWAHREVSLLYIGCMTRCVCPCSMSSIIMHINNEFTGAWEYLLVLPLR